MVGLYLSASFAADEMTLRSAAAFARAPASCGVFRHTEWRPRGPSGEGVAVGLLADGLGLDDPTVEVYVELLSEEGFPYRLITPAEVEAASSAHLGEKLWAVIIPEGAAAIGGRAAEQIRQWVERYGGKLMFVYDGGWCGSEEQGRFLLKLAGLDTRLEGGVFLGPWILPGGSALRSYFDPGVTAGDRLAVPGYPPIQSYHYPVALADPEVEELLSTSRDASSANVPVVTLRRFAGDGAVMFVNSPVGRQKVEANDDLLARVPLKFFLIEIARVPRLIAAPQGEGGIVLNLHLCARRSVVLVRKLLAAHLFTTELPLTVSVTAGPHQFLPGDRLGTDAARRGRKALEDLARYGSLGSQGGWAHGQWAYLFSHLSAGRKEKMVARNWQVMSALKGRPVTEYAAPNGRHEDRINDYLAALGVKGEAFPAAFNSPPTHPWFSRRVDARLWLFGYTSTADGSCLENMLARHRNPEEVVQEVRGQVIEQAIKRREIRLFYFHPDSVAKHPEILRGLNACLLEEIGAGRLTVRTMEEYCDFLERHQQVQFRFRRERRGLLVEAWSPRDLQEMTFALPVDARARPRPLRGEWRFRVEGGWLLATVAGPGREASLYLGDVR
ncbi:MAG: hypothetical protein ACPLPT_08415 [Moorellales bacterium]